MFDPIKRKEEILKKIDELRAEVEADNVAAVYGVTVHEDQTYGTWSVGAGENRRESIGAIAMLLFDTMKSA
jgi:hypothetical protein